MNQAIDILKTFLQEQHLPSTPLILDQFTQYLDLLLWGNRKANLIGSMDSFRIVEELFIDSLGLATLQYPLPWPLMDVGSGAGFPGIPLKLIQPDLELHLVEPRLKRHVFLGQVIRTLNLSKVYRHEGRLQDLELPKMAMVVSKAVWPMDLWISKAAQISHAMGIYGKSAEWTSKGKVMAEAQGFKVKGIWKRKDRACYWLEKSV